MWQADSDQDLKSSEDGTLLSSEATSSDSEVGKHQTLIRAVSAVLSEEHSLQ
jgi:hypothetical protein